MPKITNFVTSASINTATDMLAEGNHYGQLVVVNNGSADIYVNINANASSNGTIAGALIPSKGSMILPVHGQRVSVASGTASMSVAYFPDLN